MSLVHSHDRYLAAADELARELDRLPVIDSRPGAHDVWRAAVDDLDARLRSRTGDRPTTCAQDWKGGRFALLGLRATSTSGLPGAIRNWIDQARRKVAEDRRPRR